MCTSSKRTLVRSSVPPVLSQDSGVEAAPPPLVGCRVGPKSNWEVTRSCHILSYQLLSGRRCLYLRVLHVLHAGLSLVSAPIDRKGGASGNIAHPLHTAARHCAFEECDDVTNIARVSIPRMLVEDFGCCLRGYCYYCYYSRTVLNHYYDSSI